MLITAPVKHWRYALAFILAVVLNKKGVGL